MRLLKMADLLAQTGRAGLLVTEGPGGDGVYLHKFCPWCGLDGR
jgi:hypothetical protein